MAMKIKQKRAPVAKKKRSLQSSTKRYIVLNLRTGCTRMLKKKPKKKAKDLYCWEVDLTKSLLLNLVEGFRQGQLAHLSESIYQHTYMTDKQRSTARLRRYLRRL